MPPSRVSLPLQCLLAVYTCFAGASIAQAQPPSPLRAAAGTQHSLIIDGAGTVWAFGGNANGELGDNSTTVRRVPQPVPGLSSIIAVAAGTSHSLALSSSGTVYAFGDNAYAQVGDGTTTDRRTPIALALTNVVAIAAGDYHSMALQDDGDVYVWGRNNAGQIGNGTTTNVTAPWLLTTGAHAIGAGGSHTLVVKTDGTVWGTGADSYGQLGTSSTASSRTTLVQAAGLTTVVAVSGGSKHSVFLLADGTVQAAGYGAQGQLGRGLTSSSSTPVAVTGLSSIAAIEAGADHTLAAATDGTLYSWGEVGTGKLGTGATAHQLTHVVVTGAGSVAALSAGGDHSLTVTPAGVVATFGENGTSQLGDGATTDQALPRAISEAAYAWRVATPTFNVAPGTYTSDRTVTVSVVTAGATIHYTQSGAEPTEADPVIASGSSVTVSQSQTLKARAWKNGVPTSHVAVADYVLKPVTPTISPSAGTYTSARTVTMSTTTPGTTLRYTLDGTDPTGASTLYSGAFTVATTTTVKAVAFKPDWADSDVRSVAYTMNFGTLATPTVDPAGGTFTGQVVVTLSAEPGTTIRYTTNGATPTTTSPIYTGPLSVTDTSAVRAKAFHPDYTASAVAAASYALVTATPAFSLASGDYAPGTAVDITCPDAGVTLRWTLDGTDPTATSQILPAGPLLLGPYTVKVRAFRTGATESAVATATYALTAPLGSGAVSVGDSHVLLASPEGLLYAWGTNSNSQVGDGTATARSTPVLIPTVTGITAVAAGGTHSLAVNAAGEAWGWGNDTYGAVGDGAAGGSRSRPIRVVGVPAIAAVAAGSGHSLVLTTAGAVYAFGQGTSGQLGQGTTASSATPLLVSGVTDVVAIAAAASQSFAVTASGALWAWGANGASQLGDGSTTTRLVPTRVTGISDVVAVTAGTQHTVARTRSGALWVWGEGTSGKLGLGTTTSHATPVLLPNVSGAVLDAGANHTLLLSGTGAVLGWGVNNVGQVGIGTTTSVLQPTAALGLSGITALALGGSTSVAVALDGGVWTWGAGGAALGDGTTGNRLTPALAWMAPGRWSPPPPTLSLGTGTYTTEQVVVVTSAVPGATLRYTTNGQEPIETDPEVPTNGDVPITASATLKARAWVPGRPPSAVVAATYTLQPATPLLTPSPGSYPGPQTVTISATDPQVVLHYTIDGSTPTTSSPLYGGPFVLGATATVRARAYRPGWTPSGTVSSALTITLGTLATPTVDPPSGAYMPSQVISMAGPAGATVRYTVDGTEPIETSPPYSAPFLLSEGSLVVKARAFHADWTPSGTRTQTYTMDGTAPTIQVTTSHHANGGWYRDPVTVSFTCTDAVGISTCSGPITVAAAGDTVVTGTATDLVGQTTQVSTTIRLDFTAPSVTLTAPASDITTTAASIMMSGSVADGESGLAVVLCNDTTATVTDGVATCAVPLQEGRNSVVLVVRDAAGHVTSRGVRVTRTAPVTSLALTPATRTLLVDETVALSLLDQAGAVASGATWSTSDPNVVSLSTDDPPVLSADAAGTATITASLQGLTASATLTVVAATSLPAGTTRWTVPPPNGTTLDRIIYAHRVDESVPDLFAVSRTPDGWDPQYRVHATQADGAVAWTEVASGRPLFGDHAGGLVAAIERTGSHQVGVTGLARFAGPSAAVPWRYDSVGEIGAHYRYTDTVPIAQAPDGSIYFVEDTGEAPFEESWLVRMNGDTGATIARALLPQNRYTCNGALLATYTDYRLPVIDEAGRVQLLINGDGFFGYAGDCNDIENRSWTLHERILVLSMTDTGGLESRTVREHAESGAIGDWYQDVSIAAEQLVPDGIGGLLVQWDLFEGGVQTGHLARVLDGTVTDVTLSHVDDAISIVGDAGTTFLTSPTGTSYALDAATGATKWVSPESGAPAMSIAGGGMAVHSESTGSLSIVDGDGLTRLTMSLGAGSLYGAQKARDWIGVNSAGAADARVIPFVLQGGSGESLSENAAVVQQPLFSFRADVGSALGQRGPYPTFPTADAAALDRLRPYNLESVLLNRELGGSICRTTSGRFAASLSRPASQAGHSDYVAWSTCDSVQSVLGPVTLIGRYHTHGSSGNVGMSFGDATNAQSDPTRRWFVSSPCGGVYEYSQFTAPRPWYRWLENELALIPIYGKEIGRALTALPIRCPVDVGLAYPPPQP
jgi:alpha-tubulin suppressor-like RCC1 family protein